MQLTSGPVGLALFFSYILIEAHALVTKERERERRKIKLPNVTVVVARRSVESLDWYHEIAELPYVLETEFPRDCKHPSLMPHEFLKPRTHTQVSTLECGGFLNYIVDEYEKLPRTSIFVHGQPLGSEEVKHGDPAIFSTIRRMAVDPDKVEYCSLNHRGMWAGDGSMWGAAVPAWFGADLVANMDPMRFKHLKATLQSVFGSGQDAACYLSAQFAVSRARIRAHPLVFYKELLEWLRDATTPEEMFWERCAVIEATWHQIFGAAPVCPRDETSCAGIYGQGEKKAT
jgi:hypothetical protein